MYLLRLFIYLIGVCVCRPQYTRLPVYGINVIQRKRLVLKTTLYIAMDLNYRAVFCWSIKSEEKIGRQFTL